MEKQIERDKIMTDGGVFWGFEEISKPHPEYLCGVQHFTNLSLDTLVLLVEKGYADPQESHNNSKTIKEMMSLMKRFPELKGEGYVVSESRPDFRLTLTGLVYNGKPSIQLKHAFANMFRNADEYQNNDQGLRAWYD